ncbi:MAG: DUF6084 family protein [Candidatus Dormibacteraeota bacterium]|nr:DUF6084 family protein [Candidatus Dormibacteraeota bacterium]
MPELNFSVEGAEAVSFAATPTLALKLRVNEAGDEPVHAVLLSCQVRIEATRRRYGEEERKRLVDLFGDPSRWSETLRSLLWTNVSVNVPPFTGSILVDLQVPCTYDFNLQITKYFDGLEDGDVPLTLLFSGSIFFAGPGGALQVTRVSWSEEATYRMPVSVWQDVMRLYYPNTAWLNLRKDVFDRLLAYKSRRGLPTWEQAVESLLLGAEELRRP